MNTKINARVKQYMCYCILQNLEVGHKPIENDHLKVSTDGNTEEQVVPTLLFQVSIRVLHNNMESLPKEGGLKWDN